MLAQRTATPGSGILAVDDLKRFLSRVVVGIEPAGYTQLLLKEPILPGEAHYDTSGPGVQFRTVEKRVPHYFKLGGSVTRSGPTR